MHQYTLLATVVASYRTTTQTITARLREESATGRMMPTGGSSHFENSAHERHGEAPEVVRIRLLGDFEVSVGTRTVADSSWRLRKVASLVKLLALAPGHRLHRGRAMDLLWPELGTKAASNNLRGVLHAARKTLDPAGAPFIWHPKAARGPVRRRPCPLRGREALLGSRQHQAAKLRARRRECGGGG
jgi:hypothetical protein